MITDCRTFAFFGELRDNGRHIAPGAVTRDCKPCGIETKLAAMFGDVFRGRKTLLDRNRELCFGRSCVVYKYKRRICAVHQIPQQTVMGILAAEDPTTTVEVHDNRQGFCGPLRAIDCYGNLARRADWKDPFLNIRRQLVHFCPGLQIFRSLPRIGVRQLIDRLSNSRSHDIDEGLSCRLKDNLPIVHYFSSLLSERLSGGPAGTAKSLPKVD